ncbi:hypothetical protein ES703_71648 [subsurface metagenome]
MRKIPEFQIAFLIIMTVVLACPRRILSQQSTDIPTIGKIVRLDNRINELIPLETKIELLASGFEWSEGPLWIQEADGGYLLFSDIPRKGAYT